VNQQLFEKLLCNQHYEKYGQLGNHYVLTMKFPLFDVSKNEWDTKEDAMKNAMYTLQYTKRHLLG